MDESTKKTNPNRKPVYNLVVVKKLSEKYGLSEYYIRQCLRKDRNNITADTIQKEYTSMCIQYQKAIDAIN